MPHEGPPRDDTGPIPGIIRAPGPTQGIAGGPGPTPPGFDDGTPKPVPETRLPEPVAQEDAREVGERGGSSPSPAPAGRRRRAGNAEQRKRGPRR